MDSGKTAVIGEITDQLSKNPWLHAYRLKVALEDDAIILTGSVNSYHHKQIALTLAAKCRGAMQLRIQGNIVVNGS